MEYVLIVTGCIAPENIPYLELKDEVTRLGQYKESLLFFIKKTDINKIVFCDNSNFPFDFSDLTDEAKKYGKHIEILQYKGNKTGVLEFGKGYGEGEIIKYIFEHSELLQSAEYFFKVTGRLKISNIDRILEHIKVGENYFMANMYHYPSIDTRFYGVNKELYKCYLMNVFKNVNDDKQKYLEVCFYEALQKNKIVYRCFPFVPEIMGISGTMGQKYRRIWWPAGILESCASRIGILNNKVVYSFIWNILKLRRCIKRKKES